MAASTRATRAGDSLGQRLRFGNRRRRSVVGVWISLNCRFAPKLAIGPVVAADTTPTSIEKTALVRWWWKARRSAMFNPMLKRLYIHNFRCRENFDLALGELST